MARSPDVTPAKDDKAPSGWKVAGFLLTLAIALLGILYRDARGDISQLQAENRGATERLARLETLVQSIDGRTVRIENKLDNALDRPNVSFRPGPR
jgi:hypothetical protein